jgi:hypothetical protein
MALPTWLPQGDSGDGASGVGSTHRSNSVNTRPITNRLAAIATGLAAFAAGAGLLIPGLYRDTAY